MSNVDSVVTRGLVPVYNATYPVVFELLPSKTKSFNLLPASCKNNFVTFTGNLKSIPINCPTAPDALHAVDVDSSVAKLGN